MQQADLATTIERLFKTLAAERQYDISMDEIGVYVGHLREYGLSAISKALLAFSAESTIEDNVFPSVAEFERVIREQQKTEASSLRLRSKAEELHGNDRSLKIVT